MDAALFDADELRVIDESPIEEVLDLAADILASANTVLGGAPETPEEKRRGLQLFLKDVASKLAKLTTSIPEPLTKPGPTGTFLDLIAGVYAPQLGLSTPVLLAVFAIVASRYGLPQFVEKFVSK